MRGIVASRRNAFLSLTVFGNTVIVLGALAFHSAEAGLNPKVHGFFDCLWWAVATVTTVGYGDVIPVTLLGKLIGMAMMLLGTTLFCSFTAVFSSLIVSYEIRSVKQELDTVEQDVHSLQHDHGALDQHIRAMEQLLEKMKTIRRR
jgi:voltage-gated potassium channel